MIELREMFQAWSQQQVGNLDSYSPKPSQYQKIPIYYDDDDDEESSTPLRDIIISELPPCIAITPGVPNEIYSNPLFDEEIISIIIDLHHFNAESDLKESLFNQDSSIISSSKIDSLLDEFVGKLIFLKSISPEIDEADCDLEEEIRLIEKLLYDNSSPRPLKEFYSKNFDTIIKSFSPSPIPVEDNDSLMEEIDLSLTPDDAMPSGIKNDDYDSEGDILFLGELLSNDSLSLLENESFHFDIPSSARPPVKPPDDDKIKPDTRILTIKVVGDISEHYVLIPRLLPTQSTLASNEERTFVLIRVAKVLNYDVFKLDSRSAIKRWDEYGFVIRPDTAFESLLDDHQEQYEHRDLNKQCKLLYASDQTIQVLVAMPFYNLEFHDNNDSSLGIHITSRLPVNSETVELLTFTPPMGDSPEGMFVIAYWFINPHSPRHQVFYPLDLPVIFFLRLRDRSSIFAARGTSTKILEVIVDEVLK
uniref:Reverse transcriptase domain-containing protein n=1 Tax=Tanacetum cinerariifolium TaxID=118510 RepID=A0A6L2LRZ6_TANCI|nr:hypothetical protein [Tanacetum cinerariifolium]